jgi:N-hydroxyarylamine O-acetyltransferase
MTINLNMILERINYKGIPEVNLKTLQKLQRCFLYSVPFETLDIQLKNIITLDENRIYNKLVVNNRGGICYELNALFYLMLQKIGFNVRIV